MTTALVEHKVALLKNPGEAYVKVQRLGGTSTAVDICAGFVAPLIVAPFVAVVDGSIVNATAGSGQTVGAGIKAGMKELLFTPRHFFSQPLWRTSCALVWMVYAGTYLSANLVKSVNDAYDITGAKADTNKFLATLVMNLGLSQVKDALLVKIFSKKYAAKGQVTVPRFTRGLFLLRDGMTMVATFAVADRLARYVRDSYDVPAQRASLSANFFVPAAVQIIGTVPHLYGLNYARLKTHQGVMPLVWSQYSATLAGRVSRIVPAISVGNNINIEMRNALLKWRRRVEEE